MALDAINPDVLISADSISKTFMDFWRRPKVKAVNNVSFQVFRGEVFGMLGPNGSGKSTIIKMILGLLYPSSGNLTVLDAPPTDVTAKTRIGYLPEESYIYPYLSPVEVLDFYGRLFNLSGTELRSRVEQLLVMTGLQHVGSRQIGEFSKGMTRRVGLAQALINDPDLIILDEPTSGLDPIGRRQMKDLITALAERGKTVLLSSHLLAEVEDVCTRLIILFNGNKLVQGNLSELLEESDSYKLTFKAESDETVRKIVETVSKETSTPPLLDHPRHTLEKFFLDVVRKAGSDTQHFSGAVQADQIASFLSEQTK